MSLGTYLLCKLTLERCHEVSTMTETGTPQRRIVTPHGLPHIPPCPSQEPRYMRHIQAYLGSTWPFHMSLVLVLCPAARTSTGWASKDVHKP